MPHDERSRSLRCPSSLGVSWATVSPAIRSITASPDASTPRRRSALPSRPRCASVAPRQRGLTSIGPILPAGEVTSNIGPPVTTLERTLRDCIDAGVERRLILRALDDSHAPDALPKEAIAKLRARLS